MNVALLHYSVPPVVGGVESVIGHQARLIQAAGHRVRLLAARGAAPGPEIEFRALPLADSRHPRVLAAKAELDASRVPPDFEALVQEIGAALEEALIGIDVLIAHNVATLHKNLALTAALRRRPAAGGPRLILWHHDLAWTAAQYQEELHPGYPWDLLRTDWPMARHVAVSEPRRQELAQLLGIPSETIAVVPNGVETRVLHKLEPLTEVLVETMGLEAAEPLLLLPVRLTRRKNIEMALRILAALRGAPMPAAMLLVTGPEGPHNPANAEYRQRLLALRAELGLVGAAHFASEHQSSWLPDAVVADFLRLADALLLPSQEEGFGIPLIEAALVRLPVFCSDIPVLRDLGQGDVTYFALGADPAEIAALVAARLKSQPAYRFSARARSHYTWQQIYERGIAPLLAAPEGENK